MCGAGLKMTLSSFQDLIKTKKQNDEDDNETMNKLLYETANGALNGFISSIGLVCIAQNNECGGGDAIMMDGTQMQQQLMTSYALTGLITGTINGCINEVIHSTTSQQHAENGNEIELTNVGKTGFMEMGSNLMTAIGMIGKSTLFKSAKDDRNSSTKEIRIHFPSYRHMKQRMHDITKYNRQQSIPWKIMEYGSIHIKKQTRKLNPLFNARI